MISGKVGRPGHDPLLRDCRFKVRVQLASHRRCRAWLHSTTISPGSPCGFGDLHLIGVPDSLAATALASGAFPRLTRMAVTPRPSQIRFDLEVTFRTQRIQCVRHKRHYRFLTEWDSTAFPGQLETGKRRLPRASKYLKRRSQLDRLAGVWLTAGGRAAYPGASPIPASRPCQRGQDFIPA